MALQTVTLKWDLTDLIQSGLAATLSITPTAQMSDTTDHVLIPAVARTFTFGGGTGQLAGIVANDNAAILPAGTGYLISVTAANGQVIVPQFQTQILFANGAVQWLDALAVVPVVTTSYQYLPLGPGGSYPANAAEYLDGTGHWTTPAGGGSGTVTTVSVVSANGLAGTVANPATTPAITLSVPETGILKSNGTAVSAATAGTDYLTPTGSGAALTGITESQVSGLTADLAAKAPLASPALTGTPTAPTATALTASTQLATTAYADSAVAVEKSRAQTAEGLLAPLASPALTGTPTAPTALGGTNTTQLATTAFVAAALPTALPPNGSAGGDLSGTYPNPTVAKINGTAFSLPVSIANGGTGQNSAAAAYNALSPMTTKGDMEYDSANGTAARLAVGSAGQSLGVSGGVPAWLQALQLQAATSASGYALVNGTGTVISWTAPSDGNLHRFFTTSSIYVPTSTTGGALLCQYTKPGAAGQVSHTLYPATITAPGDILASNKYAELIAPGTTVSILQTTAMTAGAATLWAEIWGS